MKLWVFLLLLFVFVPSETLWAQSDAAPPLPSRGDALIGAPGSSSIGLFHPATYVLRSNLQLELHPLVFLVAPHATVKVEHIAAGAWHLSGQYGLAMPWLAEKLLQGYLFPAYLRGQGHIGFVLVPSVGGLLSHVTDARVITAKLDLSVGVPLSHSDLRPLEAPAPLEMLFAPVLNKYRARAGVLWDGSLSARWRMRAYADAFVHGVDEGRAAQLQLLDHLTLRAGLGVDVAATKCLRVALGIVGWNSYQFAVNDDGGRVRSTDWLPVIDLIWNRP
jgi:hypothetical protein